MNRLICLLLVVMILLGTLSACAAEPEPTEPLSWSVVEKVGRDDDEVHYRIHLSNGLTVDRYTREEE